MKLLSTLCSSLPWLLALVLAAPVSSHAQQQQTPAPGQSRSRQPSASGSNSGSPAATASPAGRGAVPASQLPVNYLLSPNDLVQIKVFQEDDMDWTVRVTKDGNVNLPVVGVINVRGKTPDQLGEVVRDRLHDGYLVHPQVNISVLEFSKRRFTILGQVDRPGQIDFPDNTTVNVLQAIGMAGGTTRRADPGRVYIKRRVGAQEIVLKVDARRMARDPSFTPFEILPGDTITVAETPF
jgi:protein involved in polysaccharide export with SLBB domain